MKCEYWEHDSTLWERCKKLKEHTNFDPYLCGCWGEKKNCVIPEIRKKEMKMWLTGTFGEIAGIIDREKLVEKLIDIGVPTSSKIWEVLWNESD